MLSVLRLLLLGTDLHWATMQVSVTLYSPSLATHFIHGIPFLASSFILLFVSLFFLYQCTQYYSHVMSVVHWQVSRRPFIDSSRGKYSYSVSSPFHLRFSPLSFVCPSIQWFFTCLCSHCHVGGVEDGVYKFLDSPPGKYHRSFSRLSPSSSC